VHNNYLTLPVLIAMLSNHFAFTYGHSHAWLILVALMAIGALVRHFFNLRHGGRNAWWIPVAATVAVAALAVAIRPQTTRSVDLGPRVSFARARAIVQARCVPCHAGASAPAGIRLSTRAEIESHAADIKRMAVDSHAMPLGNRTHMTDAERDELRRWLEAR
jgi:uncharacterized membrane protein